MSSPLPTAGQTLDISPKPGNKIIHLIRHAQGFHNLSLANHSIPDPLLTDLGKQQCASVSHSFPSPQQDSIQLLVSSPLRRTIYTALLSFPSITTRLPILCHPGLQETGAVPCDTGSTPAVLSAEFREYPFVDLHLVHEGWNNKKDFYAADADAVRARARAMRKWLREREEAVILVVTHGGFLHWLNEDWEGFREGTGTAWVNCEWRSFEFAETQHDGDGGRAKDDPRLVETRASRERRRGIEKPLGQTERKELERVEGQGEKI